MYEFQETGLHRGGYTRSKGTNDSLKRDLLKDLSREISSLRREINTMEGKYISLLAYYESVVEKNPNFLNFTSEVS